MHVKLLSLLLRGVSAAMLYYQVLVTCMSISPFTVLHGWTPLSPPLQYLGLIHSWFHDTRQVYVTLGFMSLTHIYICMSHPLLTMLLFICLSLFSLALDLVWVAFDS